MLIEKAYLPKKGHASLNILSTGRLFKRQGICIEENGIDKLRVADRVVPFMRRNYSPVVKVIVPGESASSVWSTQGEAQSLGPETTSIELEDIQVQECNVHIRGAPRHVGLQVLHKRLGHIHFAKLAEITGISNCQSLTCHECNIFKSKAPAVDKAIKVVKQEKEKKQLTPGELVCVDRWGPYKYAEIATGHRDLYGAWTRQALNSLTWSKCMIRR